MTLAWEQVLVDCADPVALGATRADVGQGDASWVVLLDPEGNEFCVLRSAQT